MPTDDDILTRETALLAADEPAPFALVNAHASRPLLLVCDHASAAFPRALGDLGLDAATRRSHRAIDIGARALAHELATRLDATAVLAGYSRLIVDCNRSLDDAQAFVEFSDGVPIPGNRGLTDERKRSRADAIHRTYHAAVDAQLARLRALGTPPAVIPIHSFTPVYEGLSRPWEAGILWDEDGRIAVPLMHGLREAGLVVGDNQPYSGKTRRLNYTLDHHAAAAGLAHACIEVRQDLLGAPEAIDTMATLLSRLLDALPGVVHAVSDVAMRARQRAHAIDAATATRRETLTGQGQTR